jgi:purine-binding chemotaxis protein CheW
MAASPDLQAPNPDRDLPATPEGALVLFALGGTAGATLCALPRGAVRAVLPLPRLESPPGLPAPLAGFLNLGGSAVPVVELAHLLGLPPGEPHPYRHLILLNVPQEPSPGSTAGPVALLVDRVADVLPAGLPLRPVEAEIFLGGVVAGAIEVPGGGTAHRLDPTRLLLAQEATLLDALARQAQARLARWEAPGGPA